MRRLTFFIFLLYAACSSFAGQPARMDSSAVEIRGFSSSDIESYKKQREFRYDKNVLPKENWWQRFWKWFWKKYYELLGDKRGAGLLRIIMWVVVIAALAFFILKVIGMDAMSALSRKNTGEGLDYNVGQEDVHAINFDAAIEEAASQRNYRLAVRLLYLQTLKKLSDNQLINWQKNKTNTIYQRELSGTKFEALFNDLTRTFEYAWYGELPLDALRYKYIDEQFKNFYRQL